MPRTAAPRLAVLLAATLLLVAGRAMADPATEQAKLHNLQAKQLFNLGLFEAAAAEYEAAYRLKPLPTFLFNLAQCYKRMHELPPPGRNLERSIFYYKSFLQNDPASPFRPKVEGEIAELERRLAELRRPPPVYRRWWFWTAIGVGIAVTGAVIGTAFALRPKDESPVLGTAGTYGLP
jgi:tetratricopeptide (TPR) repeat protein